MKRKYIFIDLLLIGAAICSSVLCSKTSSYNSGSNNPPPTGSNSVSIYNMAFTPGSLSVSVGTTVKWTNNDGVTHTVTANDGSSFDSGPIAAGASFSFKFMTAGTFNYHCTIHSGMTGTIVVTP
jgi:plastocyanin